MLIDSTVIKHGSGSSMIWIYPIGSMYAIYGNICHQYTPNVSIYIPAPWILWVYGWSFPFAVDFPAILPRISGEILQQLISKLNDPADFAGLASPLRGRGESGFRVPSYVSSSVPKPGKTYVTRWWSVLGTGSLMVIFQRRGMWCEKHLEKHRAHNDRVRGC